MAHGKTREGGQNTFSGGGAKYISEMDSVRPRSRGVRNAFLEVPHPFLLVLQLPFGREAKSQKSSAAKHP